jgi:hypothetical protein
LWQHSSSITHIQRQHFSNSRIQHGKASAFRRKAAREARQDSTRDSLPSPTASVETQNIANDSQHEDPQIRRDASQKAASNAKNSLAAAFARGSNRARTDETETAHDDLDQSWEPTDVSSRKDRGNEDTGQASTPATKPKRTGAIWTSLKQKLAGPNQTSTIDPETKLDMERWERESKSGSKDSLEEDLPSGLDGKASRKSGKKKASGMQKALEVHTILPSGLKFTPVNTEETDGPAVARLTHGLDRVLFNPGVYQLQDWRSKVYNFDPYLASIMPVDEFDFDALKAYITSSKDVKLREISAKHGMKYCGSTSSMTAILSHFHYLLSAWRSPNFDKISKTFVPDSLNFTRLTRSPAAAYARLQNGVYAIDADKQYDKENILSMLGKSMEKLLTLPKEDYERYRRTRSHQITDEERNAEEPYHYTTLGDVMMRSQLDARDPRLPGTGVFDLKTRAVVSIRMDVHGYEKGQGYEIRRRLGQWESFEREYYDLIRSAFLKYSLQVRMGRMDGIFVAYHNTQRIFGFQYIGLDEMDEAIHETSDRRLGDQEFKASIALLNDLLNRAAKRFPGRSLRLHVETRPTKVPLTYFFVEPVSDKQSNEDMRQSQEDAKRSVEKFENAYVELGKQLRDAESTTTSPVDQENDLEHDSAEVEVHDEPDDVWDEMMAMVEETVENESLGMESVREAVHNALAQRDLLRDATEEEREKYLDSLLEALTEDAPGLRETREAWEADSRSEETLDGEVVSSAYPSTKSTETSEAVSPEAPETDDANKIEDASSSRNSQVALTELIVKLTKGIDERSRELTAFERAVAERIAQSKTAKPVAELEEDEPTASGASEPAAEREESSPTEIPQTESSTKTTADDVDQVDEPKELLGLYVSIRNKVNGKYVTRPKIDKHNFQWAIQYSVREMEDDRARRVYKALKKRRKTALSDSPAAQDSAWRNAWRGMLETMSKVGEEHRKRMDREERGKSVYGAWDEKPLP